MNKVVIDFPPGAAGHFIARVLNNEYNFESGKLGEFHSLDHNYQSITSRKEDFLQQFHAIEKNKDVVCLHNFDNLTLAEYFPSHNLLNIYLDSKFDIYANNFYFKSIGSNRNTAKEFTDEVVKKYPNSLFPLREEFFNFYLWIQKSEWTKPKTGFANLPFSTIYNSEKLLDFFRNNNFLVPSNLAGVHEDFLIKQSKIIEKSRIYHSIVNAVKTQKNILVPDELNDIDFGIMSAMIYEITKKDVSNLDSKKWFKNTFEIMAYVNG